MDVARILFAVIFAVLNAAIAHAVPPAAAAPQTHTANFAGQGDWSSAGPTTAPTISANRNDRYAYPQQPNYSTATQPQSIVDRTQNAFSETANTLRDGFNAGVRAATDGQGFNQQVQSWSDSASRQLQSAGNTARSAAGQSLGTTPSRSKVSSPFVTTTPAAPAAPKSRNGLAPPTSWPTTTGSSSALSAPTWSDSTVPVAPDQNMFSTSPAPPSNQTSGGGWTSIGSTVAAPPLLLPQLPVTQPSLPSNNFSTSTTSAFPADTTGSKPSFHSPLVASSQSTAATTAARTTPNDDNWTTNWNNTPTSANSNSFNNSNNSGASISRSGSNSPPANSNRYADISATQPVAVAAQDQKKSAATNTKSTDFWGDDSWNRPQSLAPNTAASASTTTPSNTSATISKTAQSPNAGSAPSNSPVLNPPAVPSASNAINAAAPTAVTMQPATNTTAAAKPAQQATTAPAGEQKPWVALLAVVLSLAGSLAANLFLGWSYLDARQKYQSLVRRTADTFRRVKAAAA